MANLLILAFSFLSFQENSLDYENEFVDCLELERNIDSSWKVDSLGCTGARSYAGLILYDSLDYLTQFSYPCVLDVLGPPNILRKDKGERAYYFSTYIIQDSCEEGHWGGIHHLIIHHDDSIVFKNYLMIGGC